MFHGGIESKKYKSKSFLSSFPENILLSFRTARRVISGSRSFGDTRRFAEKSTRFSPLSSLFLLGLMAAFPAREWENTVYMKRLWKRRLSTVSDMFLFVGARTKKRAKTSVISWRDISRDGGDFRLIFAQVYGRREDSKFFLDR